MVLRGFKRFSLGLYTGACFLFVSTFCFAALNSYTYLFLVKTPPYPWLDWSVRHGSMFCCVAIAASVALRWHERKDRWILAAWLGQIAVGALFISAGGLLAVRNDRSAFLWCIAILSPELLAILRMTRLEAKIRVTHESNDHFSYLNAILSAIGCTVVSIAGVFARNHSLNLPFNFDMRQVEATLFIVAEYALLAILLTTVLNILQLIATELNRPSWAQPWSVLFVGFTLLDVSLLRFLTGALSIEGPAAAAYATLVSIFVIMWLHSLFGQWFLSSRTTFGHRFALAILLAALCAASILVTRWLTVEDWNDLIANSSSLAFLAFFSLTLYKLRPGRRTSYSVWAILAIVLVSGFLYFMMSQSAFLWAKQLGRTEDEVSYSLEEIREENNAWRLVNAAFDYHTEVCDDLCRTLRQYTNIHNVKLSAPVRLVDGLVPTHSRRPNIFIIVVDSLRSDFLGAYNPSVDFTPNLDKLAHDSLVMRNAFTQYAGTSLSEPAIWAGAQLLHAHYVEPFKDVNNLLTLARTDGYDVAVSYDLILQKIMAPEEHMVLLDRDKLFMQMEITSTLDQLMHWMSTRTDNGRPILFYAQPMNVHILGRNNLPPRTSQNWRDRPGFDPRISYDLHQVDDAIGKFVAYLKASGLYDESVIIITADHGDALPGLPDLGPRTRRGHSLILFPEVMRVPMLVHLPRSVRNQVIWDENRLATLTDITPSLYYLLGHRPIKHGLVYGQPLFFDTRDEMSQYRRDHLLLASDAAAEYGILSGDGRFLYAVYDSPRETLLFDLKADPTGTINHATEDRSRRYNQEILDDLDRIAKFYGYQPTGGSSGHFAFDQIQN